jgi:hypothetical protein
MAAEFIIAPEAEQDFAEAYIWYEGRLGRGVSELRRCVYCSDLPHARDACSYPRGLSLGVGAPLSIGGLLRVC